MRDKFLYNIRNKALLLYCILLVMVPFYFGYPMEWYGWVWGIVFVVSFFYFISDLPHSWRNLSSSQFQKKIFAIALLVRILYVLLSYWFYSEMSETPPFELGSPGDAWNYDDKAIKCSDIIRNGQNWGYISLFLGTDLADMGYVFYLTFIYLITDNSILITRLINSVFSAYVVVFCYKIAKRHFGEETGRLSGIICLLMPNLIFYCGLHLKEVIMVFLTVSFINSADCIILESKKWTKWGPLLLTGLVLFSFRTVLGAVAFLAFFATLLFSGGKVMNWGKRILIGIAMVVVVLVGFGGKLQSEVENVWEMSQSDAQMKNMEWRSKRKNGNEFAKYAGAAVFAPLIFTIPFPTMVATPVQENQRLIHGGNFVKNVLSFFTIAAVLFLLISGDWRKHVLIMSFTIGYLIVLVFSTFAQSERFHQPVLPMELIFAAYGITVIPSRKIKNLFNLWVVFLFVADMGWQWFKLRGRGM